MNEVNRMNKIHINYIFRHKFRTRNATICYFVFINRNERVNQSLEIHVL